MTLPSTIVLPLRRDSGDSKDVERYLVELVFELQNMYEDLADAINGDIKASAYTQRNQWTPTLEGTTNAGEFTYVHQIGWVLRRNLLTTIWFDIEWNANVSATGNLYIRLPYRVARSEEMPFSAALQTSTIAYGAGKTILSVNAIPNTVRGEIWSSGSGVVTANVGVAGAGRLIGSLNYLGVNDET